MPWLYKAEMKLRLNLCGSVFDQTGSSKIVKNIAFHELGGRVGVQQEEKWSNNMLKYGSRRINHT